MHFYFFVVYYTYIIINGGAILRQSKINCPSCRRTYKIDLPSCPFCQKENPYNRAKEEVDNDTNDLDKLDDPDDLDASNDESKEVENDLMDEEEEYIPKTTNIIKCTPKSQPRTNTGNDDTDFTEDHDLSSTATKNREAIAWTDEPVVESPDYSKMYDSNGVYNANFDHYYDDTIPAIQNEVDRLLKGREKTILKIIGSVVAIFAIICYLILTMNV